MSAGACRGCRRRHDDDAKNYHASRHWTSGSLGLLCRTCTARVTSGALVLAPVEVAS